MDRPWTALPCALLHFCYPPALSCILMHPPASSPIIDDSGNSLRIRLRRYRPHICAALRAQITNFGTRGSQKAFFQKSAQKTKIRFATVFPNRVEKIQPGWNSNLALLFSGQTVNTRLDNSFFLDTLREGKPSVQRKRSVRPDTQRSHDTKRPTIITNKRWMKMGGVMNPYINVRVDTMHPGAAFKKPCF